jgi:hypothetical protein
MAERGELGIILRFVIIQQLLRSLVYQRHFTALVNGNDPSFIECSIAWRCSNRLEIS